MTSYDASSRYVSREPIHVNEKYHAVDKMNDESDESVHLSPCVYVKDEPVHGNTL